MDVEIDDGEKLGMEGTDKQPAASQVRELQGFFPSFSCRSLKRALSRARGNVEAAALSLLEPAVAQSGNGHVIAESSGSSGDSDGVEATWPADSTNPAPTPSRSRSRRATSADSIAVEEGSAETDKLVRDLGRLLPDHDPGLLRQVLQETGNNADATMNRMLGFSASSSSSSNRAPPPESEVEAVTEPTPLEALERVLPDCAPDHLAKVLEEVGGDQNKAALQILSSGSYPKREKLQKRGRAGSGFALSSAPASTQRSGSFAESECAAPDDGRGAEYWFEPSRRTSERRSVKYNQEAKDLLLDEFRELGRPGIMKVFDQSSGLYCVAWKRCYEAVGEIIAGRCPHAPLTALKCPRKPTRNVEELKKGSIKALLLKSEFQFVRWWLHQGKQQEQRKKQREEYLKECEAKGLLLECECCYSENLPEETAQCAAGHLFCGTCTKNYVDSQLSGEAGVPKLVCMSTSSCPEQLPRSELARVLPASVLEAFDQRLEKASIEAALLRGCLTAEKCPFCDYVVEMTLSPEENKIFVCQNDDCGKESCRLCKEENHIPLRCDEVEKKSQQGHRLAVVRAPRRGLVGIWMSPLAEESAQVVAAACGAGRFLPVPSLLRSAAVSSAWRDGVTEALSETEEVDLHRNARRITDADATRVLRACPQARKVNLCDCRQLHDLTVSVLAQACPRLEELNITGNPNATVSSIDEVVRCCTKLETLHLAGCDRIPEHAILKKYSRYCDIFDEAEEGPWAA